MPSANLTGEDQTPKAKLAESYQELLSEFSSKDLRTVGNYSLGRLIGKGAFGRVYLASHKLTNGSKVVLKSANKDDPNLAREIHHHRQFLHPHIARLYEVIVTETLVWLVLEYCPGDELYNYLLRHGPLPVAQVQRIFSQLVGAVAYVHQMSCVHRDLKLENILLDKNGDVKLCDFGFTREYEGKMNYLQTFCGTVCYSAPEMLKGEKYAGEKVDVWSLGIILFALLTGELPYDDDDDMAIKHKILTSDPKFPETMTAEAQSLIVRLLSKRALHRPSISDVMNDSFLADHARWQQSILRRTRSSPFSSDLEKVTLQRMRSAGVDIDKVIEHVLSQRCDALAGWWALLIEKEERKQKKREHKRKDNEVKASHRLSAGSRIDSSLLATKDNADGVGVGASRATNLRPGHDKRSLPTPQLVLPELPQLPEGAMLEPSRSAVHLPSATNDRSHESSTYLKGRSAAQHQKPQASSYNGNPQLVDRGPPRLVPKTDTNPRLAKKQGSGILSQLTAIKKWFKEGAKRSKVSNRATGHDGPGKLPPTGTGTSVREKKQLDASRSHRQNVIAITPTRQISNGVGGHPHLSTPRTRASLSPSPLTPRSSRRLSAGPVGLRGRKSTSSSISSIRSIHHYHTHSKASSTSSTTASIQSTMPFAKSTSRSPHSSNKNLPSTPMAGEFPPNIRVARGVSTFNEAAIFNSPSNTVFMKRRKTPFRGRNLTVSTSSIGNSSGRTRDSTATISRSASAAGRASGEIIQEEDEDEVEEVDTFSPLAAEAEETGWNSAHDPEIGSESWLRRSND